MVVVTVLSVTVVVTVLSVTVVLVTVIRISNGRISNDRFCNGREGKSADRQIFTALAAAEDGACSTPAITQQQAFFLPVFLVHIFVH